MKLSAIKTDPFIRGLLQRMGKWTWSSRVLLTFSKLSHSAYGLDAGHPVFTSWHLQLKAFELAWATASRVDHAELDGTTVGSYTAASKCIFLNNQFKFIHVKASLKKAFLSYSSSKTRLSRTQIEGPQMRKDIYFGLSVYGKSLVKFPASPGKDGKDPCL